MRATRAEVAKMAGVSPSVVSYVLNGGPRNVAPETRRRVEEAIASLEYRPNAIAQALRGGRSGAIGVVVGAGQEHLFRATSLALQKAALSIGYATYVSFASGPATERQYARSLADRQVDALIAIELEEPVALEELHDNGMPIAVIGERAAPDWVFSLSTDPSAPHWELLSQVTARRPSVILHSSRLAQRLDREQITGMIGTSVEVIALDLDTVTGGADLIRILRDRPGAALMCATDNELRRATWLAAVSGIDPTEHTFTTSRVDLRASHHDATIAVSWDLDRPLSQIFDGLLRMIDNPDAPAGPVPLPWRIDSHTESPGRAPRIWDVEDL